MTDQNQRQQLIDKLNQLAANNSDITINSDADAREQYGRDWTRVHSPDPLAIAFPRSVEAVQQLVLWANEHRLAIVPSGGRTGLSGGAMACEGELVVSLEKMNQILDFNPVDRSVTCQAGVITEVLQNFAEEQGLYYPVDFASRGSSQIGGNIATNAGGIKVIRYGMTRDWVAGLTVVTGKGDILKLNLDLVKNASGYDLRHLFIGSEGTLGIVTEACIRLTSKPKSPSVMVMACHTMSDVMNILRLFQQQIELSAFEFFTDNAMQQVLAKSVPAPFDTRTRFYVLIEAESNGDQVEELLLNLYEQCAEQSWLEDGVMSQSDQQAADLWRLREEISESIAQFTPYKNDVSVTVSKVPEFLAKVDPIISREYPDYDVLWYGHIGDGNVHINILKPENLSKEQFVASCEQVNRLIFDQVKAFGGSISAEHGVGLLKKNYLDYTREATEISYLKQIKQVFDPNNIMNPGKILDC